MEMRSANVCLVTVIIRISLQMLLQALTSRNDVWCVSLMFCFSVSSGRYILKINFLKEQTYTHKSKSLLSSPF